MIILYHYHYTVSLHPSQKKAKTRSIFSERILGTQGRHCPFFELPGRDLWALHRSGFLCCAAFVPGLAAVLFRPEETLKARRDAEINERLAAREAENHDL